MNEKIIIMPENFAVDEATLFRENSYHLIAEGQKDFSLDFRNCKFIDSTGLGVLVSIYKKCVETKGSIKLLHMNDQVLKVFKLTRLDSVFEIVK